MVAEYLGRAGYQVRTLINHNKERRMFVRSEIYAVADVVVRNVVRKWHRWPGELTSSEITEFKNSKMTLSWCFPGIER